jgi:hypothetical protein
MKKILGTIILLLLTTQSAKADCYICGLGRTFTNAFDTTGLIVLAVGAGATAVAFSQDQVMHDSWVNNQRMGKDISGFGNFWGTGIPEASIALAQLIWDNKNGVPHSQSLIMSTGVVYGLKYATQRPRPDSDTKTSFPSGHTQVSFVTATHIAVAYGVWPSLPFFGAGIITGLSRLADNAHWFSDVVAGATVGILFGRSSFEKNYYISSMKFAPGDRGYGLELTYLF